MGTVVLHFDPERVTALRAVLRASDFAFEERPHALFLARRPGVAATAYASGKLLLTGEQAEEYAFYLQNGSHGLALAPAAGTPTGAPGGGALPFPRIGSDESGKGAYFGPLVVAAVLLPDRATGDALRDKGVRDSKLVPDAEAALLGSLVAARCPHEVVALAPPRYNEVYAKTRNLNRLLAWGHARAIEDLLARHPDVDAVTVDRFAKGSTLADALMERGRRVAVAERERAESGDLAVAAASLLARAEFLRALAAMEARWGQRFPKGAAPVVVAAGRAFVRRHGRSALGDVAKLHFATTLDVERAGGA